MNRTNTLKYMLKLYLPASPLTHWSADDPGYCSNCPWRYYYPRASSYQGACLGRIVGLSVVAIATAAATGWTSACSSLRAYQSREVVVALWRRFSSWDRLHAWAASKGYTSSQNSWPTDGQTLWSVEAVHSSHKPVSYSPDPCTHSTIPAWTWSTLAWSCR